MKPAIVIALLATGLIAPAAAWAAAADELTGLFVQGCLPFAGHPAALRDWAARNSLQAAPDQARSAFLHGAPGQVFDASANGVKLALISSDDGICSAVTDKATRQAVTDALEAGFRDAAVTFRLVIERDDAHIGAIHDREYLASKDKVAWRVLAATVKDEAGGEAMLTAAPE